MAPISGRSGGIVTSMIGQILSNRYKLLDELGHGGMAWVYLAQDLCEERPVAVKILYPQLGQDPGFFQRFSQEARLAMGLSQSSPEMHVVSVLDYGSDRDVHYLVMEYVPGQDLRHAMEEWGTLTWEEALDIGRQVALALGHAHRHGIVHRDVKPENIMMLPDGAVRVLDFGVARARNSPPLTHSGFVGSPYYAAPEQVMGRIVDVRADLYSLGVVLYEMIAGDRPFASSTPWSVINQHLAGPPPALEDSHPDLPRSVARLIRKAMARRPEDRFSSPAQMVEAIEAVLAGRELPTQSRAVEPEVLAPLLAGLYRRARQAAAEAAWHEAVDLFGQVLQLDARYRDASEQLAEAGRQARLAALYKGARRSLEDGDWTGARVQLAEIVEVAPGYRDAGDLLAQARHKEEVDRLYRQGAGHLEAGEWAAAIARLRKVRDREPSYLQVDELLAAAHDAREKEKREEAQAATGSPGREGQHRNLLWGIVAVLILALAVECYLFYRTQQPRAAAAVPAGDPLVLSAPAAETPANRPSAPPVDPARTVLLPAATATTRPPASPLPSSATPVVSHAIEPSPSAFSTTLTPSSPAGDTPDPPLAGQIAFPRFDPARGTYDVYACRVDGSGCRRLATEASQPDFAPDGTSVVVHSWIADRKGLVLQSRSGAWLWQITGSIEAARPSVDFQGNTYVYHSRDESDRQPRLYCTDGTAVRPILRQGSPVRGQSPSWLPNGEILYSGCLGDACGIVAMRPDGTLARQIVAGSSDTNPEASPDGRHVVFMSSRDGNWEVYRVEIDGSHLQRLTRNPANDGLPAWSPDGRHVAFVSDRGGQWAVWAMHPDGSEPRRLFGLGRSLDGRVHDAAPHEIHGWVEERISWAPLP
jgi:hypothetical protein